MACAMSSAGNSDQNAAYQNPVDFRTTFPTKHDFGPKYDPKADNNGVVYTFEKLRELTKPEIREILIDMLRREEELRLCPEVQLNFGKIGEAHEDFNSFVTMLQEHVSLEFKVDPKVGVELIRSAVSLFPEDEELKSVPHYVRHNRCKAGNITAGNPPPDCDVVDLDGNAQRLSDLLAKDRPVVLLGASHT